MTTLTAPPAPLLCWVVDGDTLDSFGAAGLDSVLREGVDWIQLRDRERDGEGLLELADRLVRATRGANRPSRVFVNRRVDVALAAGADGVHLGFDGMPSARARALLGKDAPVGVSTHAPEEALAQQDASYVQLAPIHAPLSKRSTRTPLGCAALREACRGGTPVIAQGGLDAGNAADAIAAGAAGIAVSGALSGADDPQRAARALRDALDRAAAGAAGA